MTNHTPTPWVIIKTDEDGYAIHNTDGYLITHNMPYYNSAPDFNDAYFIIRACNAHDALVEALEFYDKALECTNASDMLSMMKTFKRMKNNALMLAKGGIK